MRTCSTIFIFLLISTIPLSAQINWTKDPNNPVMSGGASGSWNRHVFMPSVLYNSDSSRYEMWFGASYGGPTWRPYAIGFATSLDGITWTKQPDPVLQVVNGTWEESTVEGPMVIRENGIYKMWYSGWSPDSSGIGYATSSDGINWIRYAGNPILTPGNDAWEAGVVAYCSVMPDHVSGYKMWYGGADLDESKWHGGYATSADGITWIKADSINPVFSPGQPGQWDDYASGVIGSLILLINNKYHAFFTGMRNNTNYDRAIGWATSDNGIQWTKYNNPNTTSPLYADSDPVILPTPGDWDGNLIEAGTVILIDDTLHMWYSGVRFPSNTYLWRIGHVTLPLIELAIEQAESNHFSKVCMLRQNYHNPFNPSTTIQFQIPNSEFTTLKVYDILGKEVATLVSGKLNQGNHTCTFDGKNLASGIYYYQLVAGEYREVKKMILLR